MDDSRQFGDCLGFEIFSRDTVDFRDLGLRSQLLEFNRSLSLKEDLARIVEAEIVPRLMLSHCSTAAAQPCGILPDAEQIRAFAALILAPTGDDTEVRVAELLVSGLPLDSLLLDLLAPTARHLGTLWEEDLCDFVEVTRAMGRLQSIMRDITRRFETEPMMHREDRRILLMPCPGETHGFGLTMVEGFFRDAGWDVTSTGARPIDDLAARVRTEWFDLVGLSLACEVMLPRMTETITVLRQHSRNPALRVMVGGAAFARHPDAVGQVGADAWADDARRAPRIAENLLDLPARAC